MKTLPAKKSATKAAPKKTTLRPPSKTVGYKKKSKLPIEKEMGSLQFTYSSADDNDVLKIIEQVRDGIPFKDFTSLVEETPFTMSEWASYLQLSERTLHRNQKEKKPFQPVQSERIIELFMLYQYGTEVFGEKENFDKWLNARSVALGGIAPKELLDTKFGISMVKDALTRIEHGILA